MCYMCLTTYKICMDGSGENHHVGSVVHFTNIVVFKLYEKPL